MPNRHATDGSYRYGFNGKEKDDEVKGEGEQYNYGFRIYDPRIGKFLSKDPLFQSFPWLTPYQFAGNSPIMFVDLDGLEKHWYLYRTDAKKKKPTITHVKDDKPDPLMAFLDLNVEHWSIYQTKLVHNGGFWGNKTEYQFLNEIIFDNIEDFLTAKEALENGITTYEELHDNYTNEVFKAVLSAAVLDLHGRADAKMTGYVNAKMKAAKINKPVKTNVKQSIKLKDNSPQIGTNFESFAINIKGGKININGRYVTNGKFDFIVDNAGNLKIGSGHYNLSGGASSVQAAGEIKIYKGKVTSITNSSGHYKPNSTEASNYSIILQKAGVDVKGANLKVYGNDGTLISNTKL